MVQARIRGDNVWVTRGLYPPACSTRTKAVTLLSRYALIAFQHQEQRVGGREMAMAGGKGQKHANESTERGDEGQERQARTTGDEVCFASPNLLMRGVRA